MRKLFLIAVLLLILLPSASAKTEVWLGGSFLYDMNFISDDLKEYFPAYAGQDTRIINNVGGMLNLAVFPTDRFRAGFFINGAFGFPVGYARSDGTVVGYTSYEFDYRFDAEAGFAYFHFFNAEMGLLAELGGKYSWYRVAEENEINQREPGPAYYFEEFSIVANLGIVARYRDSYFRLTLNGTYNITHISNGFRVGLSAGGGVIF